MCSTWSLLLLHTFITMWSAVCSSCVSRVQKYTRNLHYMSKNTYPNCSDSANESFHVFALLKPWRRGLSPEFHWIFYIVCHRWPVFRQGSSHAPIINFPGLSVNWSAALFRLVCMISKLQVLRFNGHPVLREASPAGLPTVNLLTVDNPAHHSHCTPYEFVWTSLIRIHWWDKFSSSVTHMFKQCEARHREDEADLLKELEINCVQIFFNHPFTWKTIPIWFEYPITYRCNK